MLTAEQHAIRATGIGASEIAAVAGLSPYQSPIDVWLRKPTANRAALDSDDGDSGPAEVGSILEPAVLELYTRRTGNAAERPLATRRHPEHEWVLASPDGVVNAERLVEVKVVGTRMASDWDDGVPDYVRCQCLWQAFVTGAELVDVAALLGTDFRVYSVERDDAIIADLFEIGREFWFERVLTDTPPPPTPTEDRKEYLRKRFAVHTGEMITPTAEELAEYWDDLRTRERQAKQASEAATDALNLAQGDIMMRIGDKAGVLFADGSRYTWKAPESGAISYKAIAEALAPFGKIPAELLAQHTSAPTRRFAYYAPKKRKGA